MRSQYREPRCRSSAARTHSSGSSGSPAGNHTTTSRLIKGLRAAPPSVMVPAEDAAMRAAARAFRKHDAVGLGRHEPGAEGVVHGIERVEDGRRGATLPARPAGQDRTADARGYDAASQKRERALPLAFYRAVEGGIGLPQECVVGRDLGPAEPDLRARQQLPDAARHVQRTLDIPDGAREPDRIRRPRRQVGDERRVARAILHLGQAELASGNLAARPPCVERERGARQGRIARHLLGDERGNGKLHQHDAHMASCECPANIRRCRTFECIHPGAPRQHARVRPAPRPIIGPRADRTPRNLFAPPPPPSYVSWSAWAVRAGNVPPRPERAPDFVATGPWKGTRQ